MCGRYTQLRSWSELVQLYRITETGPPPNLPPRYNVAPTQVMPVVRTARDGGGRELALLRWGLVPSWAKSIDVGARMINARAETVADKPAFRNAFRRRRCLVVADGFYEWQGRASGPKQPYFITVAGDRPFAFAGLWEVWAPAEGERVETFTIVTTEANAACAPIHNRMPVILDEPAFDLWLDTGRPVDAARPLLQPYTGDLTIVPVGRRVNDVRNDDPACIQPAL
jgi:putative SOS response-associated peptidase YedK